MKKPEFCQAKWMFVPQLTRNMLITLLLPITYSKEFRLVKLFICICTKQRIDVSKSSGSPVFLITHTAYHLVSLLLAASITVAFVIHSSDMGVELQNSKSSSGRNNKCGLSSVSAGDWFHNRLQVPRPKDAHVPCRKGHSVCVQPVYIPLCT